MTRSFSLKKSKGKCDNRNIQFDPDAIAMKNALMTKIVFDNVHKDLVFPITINVNTFVGMAKKMCRTVITP